MSNGVFSEVLFIGLQENSSQIPIFGGAGLSVNCVDKTILLSQEVSVTCRVYNTKNQSQQISFFLEGTLYDLLGERTDSKNLITKIPREEVLNISNNTYTDFYLKENLPVLVDSQKEFSLNLTLISEEGEVYRIPIILRKDAEKNLDFFSWFFSAWNTFIIDFGGGKQVVRVPNIVPLFLLIAFLYRILCKKR